MTEQQQRDLRHDEVQAGTTTGLAAPDVDVTKERQNSLWSDAWRSLKRNPLFWIGTFLAVVFVVMALVPQLFSRGADPRDWPDRSSSRPPPRRDAGPAAAAQS